MTGLNRWIRKEKYVYVRVFVYEKAYTCYEQWWRRDKFGIKFGEHLQSSLFDSV